LRYSTGYQTGDIGARTPLLIPGILAAAVMEAIGKSACGKTE